MDFKAIRSGSTARLSSMAEPPVPSGSSERSTIDYAARHNGVAFAPPRQISPMHGIHDGLKRIMGSELLVDVVEMDAEVCKVIPRLSPISSEFFPSKTRQRYALFLFRE